MAAAAAPARWEVLGQREVDFRNDHDTIDVGRSEGRFRQLQLRVKNAPIEVSNMVVTSPTIKPSSCRCVKGSRKDRAFELSICQASGEPSSGSISITKASTAAKEKEWLKCWAAKRRRFGFRGRCPAGISPEVGQPRHPPRHSPAAFCAGIRRFQSIAILSCSAVSGPAP